VKQVWISDTRTDPEQIVAATRERVLPTGHAHLVFRLTDTPLRLYDGENDRRGHVVSCAVVGGPRSSHYLRDISEPSRSVGAQLHPGAAELLFSVPADELADRHTPLEDLWGAEAAELRDRLLEAGRDERPGSSPFRPAAVRGAHKTGGEEAQLALFESILAARLPRVRGMHPAIAHALERFNETDAVSEVVEECGYSHRRFIVLFRRAVGLSPKLYCRVLRFQRAIESGAADPAAAWVELALEAGYSDQPHLSREFRQITGLAPSEYRELSPLWRNHVPIREIREVNSVQDPGEPSAHSGEQDKEDPK
jgi:AraC-like DNA-binding protein